MSFAWPDQRLVIVIDLSDDERDELTDEGWSVVDVDELITRLTAGAGV